MTTFIPPPFRGCLLEKERSNLKKDRDFVSKKRAKERERERGNRASRCKVKNARGFAPF